MGLTVLEISRESSNSLVSSSGTVLGDRAILTSVTGPGSSPSNCLSSLLNLCFVILGRITITVLPPIETTGLGVEDLPHLMTTTHTTMSQVFATTTNELMEELKLDRSAPLSYRGYNAFE